MRPEENTQAIPEDNDFPVLDLDDVDELDEIVLSDNDDSLIQDNLKSFKKDLPGVRRSIEDILAERELQRQLSDVFDEDILLD